MMYVEWALRWAFGLQMVFWGSNGFFHWVQIPPSPAVIEKFTNACLEARFIMPTVKVLEITAGFFLLINFYPELALALLAPIIFVIAGLHALHNPKPGAVLIPIVLPYAALLLLHAHAFLASLH